MLRTGAIDTFIKKRKAIKSVIFTNFNGTDVIDKCNGCINIQVDNSTYYSKREKKETGFEHLFPFVF